MRTYRPWEYYVEVTQCQHSIHQCITKGILINFGDLLVYINGVINVFWFADVLRLNTASEGDHFS
jgi:hypothetical protein